MRCVTSCCASTAGTLRVAERAQAVRCGCVRSFWRDFMDSSVWVQHVPSPPQSPAVYSSGAHHCVLVTPFFVFLSYIASCRELHSLSSLLLCGTPMFRVAVSIVLCFASTGCISHLLSAVPRTFLFSYLTAYSTSLQTHSLISLTSYSPFPPWFPPHSLLSLFVVCFCAGASTPPRSRSSSASLEFSIAPSSGVPLVCACMCV